VALQALAPVALMVLMQACQVPINDLRFADSVAVSSGVDRAIVDETNRARARAGRAALAPNARLREAAALHAQQAARLGRLDHVMPAAPYPRPNDRLAAVGYRWQATAENLAFGPLEPPAVVAGWMASAIHRRNLVNPAYTELGAAHARDASGQRYYVVVLAKPRAPRP
jgi:uncharacterized protein YkwD